MSKRSLQDIVMICSPNMLKPFRFIIDGNFPTDPTGEEVISLLEYGLHQMLESLRLDTTECLHFGHDPEDLRSFFKTVETLRDFRSLRRLSISNDSIYYPSLYPRVLLCDPYTGDPEAGTRLVNFLPRSLESVEVTGIYAIHLNDVSELVDACGEGKQLQYLRERRPQGRRPSALSRSYALHVFLWYGG
ncbi:hypothetical protein VTI74DRAFT_2557 [Chaetomium olivicolor]